MKFIIIQPHGHILISIVTHSRLIECRCSVLNPSLLAKPLDTFRLEPRPNNRSKETPRLTIVNDFDLDISLFCFTTEYRPVLEGPTIHSKNAFIDDSLQCLLINGCIPYFHVVWTNLSLVFYGHMYYL